MTVLQRMCSVCVWEATAHGASHGLAMLQASASGYVAGVMMLLWKS